MHRRDVLKATAAVAAASLLPPDALLAAPGPTRRPRLVLRRSNERGRANHGWLDARHSFSFARYHDPRHMGFRGLRVINEDRIRAGRGFPMHPHKNMEILTCVLEGALEHKDSLGNGGIIRPGEIQRMSAGRGIYHSEFNPLRNDDVHLLQIWILPSRTGVRPSYAQQAFPVASRKDRLRRLASPGGADASISINTNVNLYGSVLAAGKKVVHDNPSGRHVWIQIVRGGATINGQAVQAGDAARTSDPGRLEIHSASAGAEFLLFDLA